MKHLSISFKLFVYITVLMILPLNILTYIMKSEYEDYIVTELTGTITQSILQSKEDIYANFDLLTNISNLMVSDITLRSSLENQDSYYDKTIAFDSLCNQILNVNMLAADKVQITILGESGEIFSNWNRNFHDYSFLADAPWMTDSKDKKGHVQWIIFTDGFIIEDSASEKYVGLTREILSDVSTGRELGTLIVSMRQKEISKILERYCYSENDCVYLCDENNRIVMRLDARGAIAGSQDQYLPEFVWQGGESSEIVNINGRKYLVCDYMLDRRWSISGKQIKIYHFLDYQTITNKFQNFSNIINLFIIIFFIFMLASVFYLSRFFVKPIKKLSNKMMNWKMDAPENMQGLDLHRSDEIGDINRSFQQMDGNIRLLVSRIKTEQAVKQRYHLNYLKSQLNPHFLFNSLGTIRWMAILQGENSIVSAIDSLSCVLKYSMGKSEEQVEIKEEIEMIREYIKINNARYGMLVTLETEIADDLYDYRILRFILQPVVENALIHGFSPETQDGLIKIKIIRKDAELHIFVEDNGNGMSPQELDALNRKIHEPSEEKPSESSVTLNQMKIGLRNIHLQIRIHYGSRFGIRAESAECGGLRVCYTLPVLEEAPKEDL